MLDSIRSRSSFAFWVEWAGKGGNLVNETREVGDKVLLGDERLPGQVPNGERVVQLLVGAHRQASIAANAIGKLARTKNFIAGMRAT